MAVITILSDFGTTDVSVSAAKALLQSKVPGADIADIAHCISPYNIQRAAYISSCAYAHFPAGTIHMLLVDIFSGERPRMLLAEYEGFYFIAPDNGILSLTLGPGLKNVWLCGEFNEYCTFRQWLMQAISVINLLEQPETDLRNYFMPFIIKKIPRLLAPMPVTNGLDCNILHIDRYGNVVVNISPQRFHEAVQDKPFSIRMRDKMITSVSSHYKEVETGVPLCRFNSSGFLEIAVNHGSAAEMLELQGQLARNLSYQSVTINFQ